MTYYSKICFRICKKRLNYKFQSKGSSLPFKASSEEQWVFLDFSMLQDPLMPPEDSTLVWDSCTWLGLRGCRLDDGEDEGDGWDAGLLDEDDGSSIHIFSATVKYLICNNHGWQVKNISQLTVLQFSFCKKMWHYRCRLVSLGTTVLFFHKLVSQFVVITRYQSLLNYTYIHIHIYTYTGDPHRAAPGPFPLPAVVSWASWQHSPPGWGKPCVMVHAGNRLAPLLQPVFRDNNSLLRLQLI